MSTRWMPDGYSTVSPYLIVPDADGVIAFMERALGATQVRRFDKPDGTLLHGEMRIGDSVIMLGQANEHWPAAPAHIHVYVEDVDATYRRALAAGGEAVQEPKQNEGDTDRRGGVRDPGGTTWWVATQVSTTPLEAGSSAT